MRRALVTGGSGAIGAAICRRLAADGLYVIVHAHRRPEAADALVREIAAGGGSAEAVRFDVTDAERTAAALAGIVAAGPVQVLVNNAGVHSDAPMPGMTGAQWREVLDVNLTGFFNVTQPLLLPMIQTRWGRIVCVSSVAAVLGNRGQANYAAAKAGLHGGGREEDFRGIPFRGGGDLIVAIDGNRVASAEDVVRVVTEQLFPGQTTRLTVLRGGERLVISVVLGDRPANPPRSGR